MEKRRALLAEGDPLLRQAIVDDLTKIGKVRLIAKVENGWDVMFTASQLKPDIILMDFNLPGISGLEATSHIKQHHPEIKVLVLTMHQSDEYFFKSLHAGASGYFVKGGSSAELMTALRAVSRGEIFLHPSMTKKLITDYIQGVHSGQAKGSYDGLTSREREILQLIAEDRSNQEIAELLVISPATVQTHRNHIMAKLGLHSRSELTKYALRHGYITLDD